MKKCLLLFLCLLLAGCQSADSKQQATPGELVLSPYNEEKLEERSQNVTIYTYNEKRDKLTSSVVTAPAQSGMNKANAALTALFDQHAGFSFVKAEDGNPAYHLTITNKIAIVQIKNSCPNTDPFTRLKLHMSVVNTLCNQESIDYVIAYAGKEELGGSAYLGPSRFYDGYLQDLYHDLYQKEKGEQDTVITVPLFFADKNQSLILPEARQLSVSPKRAEECIRAAIFLMMNGPVNTSDFRQTLSADLLVQSVRVAGDHMTIDLSRSPATNLLSQEQLAYGAMTMTIRFLYPQLSAITFTVNGQPVATADYAQMIGCNTTLYLTKQDTGSLTPVTRAIPIAQYNDPAATIRQLLLGPTDADGQAIQTVFPQGLGENDLLSCRIVGNTAVVDFRRSFYEQAKDMDAAAESLMVYAMVNSLSNIEQVMQVQFLIEGQRFPSVAGHIDYSRPLIPNPGLILKQS